MPHRPFAFCGWLAALLCFVAPSYALTPDERIENFRLLDHLGASHELYRLADQRAVVFMVQGNGCPIVRNAMPRFREIRDAYQQKDVSFFLINSNLQDERESVAREVAEFGYDLPVLMDPTQLIGESLGLVRTGEVFVIDPKRWTLAYHGALDDRLTYEKQKPKAQAHYLTDALDDLLANRDVQRPQTEAVGCLINFPGQRDKAAHQQISYSKTIAPLLARNCVTCHREGGIAPWAMTDYNMVRGFSPMIREVLRTQRMPPWHADPAYGHWQNDRSLTADELKTLVHWIEAGSPRGDGDDPLAETQQRWPEWQLGEPDLVVDIPPFEFPATGTVEYQYQTVRNPLDRDVWVRATEILPGDRAALHHVITTFFETDSNGRPKRRTGGSLGGYVPGSTAEAYPENAGVLLPAGAVLRFQMHYTTYGKAASDASRLGLYFYDEPPKHAVQTAVFMNQNIHIPANAANHSETASQILQSDVLVYTLLPHAHYRGKASEFRALYPDGREEVLLSVPNYDFNWQTTYELSAPKRLPAGTKIVHRTWWDNSAQNPANPDPSRDVPWGEQSWDEMLFGAMTYRFLAEEELASGERVPSGTSSGP